VVGSALCGLAAAWSAFVNDLKNPGDSQKLVVYNLFKASIDGVTAAFARICLDATPPGNPPPLPKPSLVLADAQQLFVAFKALFDDVRARVTGLIGNPQDVIDLAVAAARPVLDELVKAIPVPTSISLSYDWHPDIQPYEPVFLLNEGADFTVSVAANIPLLSGSPTVDIEATLKNFSINLIGSPSFVIVTVDSLKFTSHNGRSPDWSKF
jgi:hypothetical protein